MTSTVIPLDQVLDIVVDGEMRQDVEHYNRSDPNQTTRFKATVNMKDGRKRVFNSGWITLPSANFGPIYQDGVVIFNHYWDEIP